MVYVTKANSKTQVVSVVVLVAFLAGPARDQHDGHNRHYAIVEVGSKSEFDMRDANIVYIGLGLKFGINLKLYWHRSYRALMYIIDTQ